MGILGIGLPELVFVLLIAVIAVGPRRLPELAIQLTRAVRQLQGRR